MATGIGPATRRGEVRIVSFNVNGLHTCAPKGTKDLLASLPQSNAATILCVQEVKCRRGALARIHGRVEGYHAIISLCSYKPYAGTGTFIPNSVLFLGAADGIADDVFFKGPIHGISRARLQEMDNEGRFIATDHGDFVLINVYVPATSTEDEDKKVARRAFKRDFLMALESRCRQLRDQNREVILVGDMNAIYAENKIARSTLRRGHHWSLLIGLRG